MTDTAPAPGPPSVASLCESEPAPENEPEPHPDQPNPNPMPARSPIKAGPCPRRSTRILVQPGAVTAQSVHSPARPPGAQLFELDATAAIEIDRLEGRADLLRGEASAQQVEQLSQLALHDSPAPVAIGALEATTTWIATHSSTLRRFAAVTNCALALGACRSAMAGGQRPLSVAALTARPARPSREGPPAQTCRRPRSRTLIGASPPETPADRLPAASSGIRSRCARRAARARCRWRRTPPCLPAWP